jgi:hypothetical protein
LDNRYTTQCCTEEELNEITVRSEHLLYRSLTLLAEQIQVSTTTAPRMAYNIRQVWDTDGGDYERPENLFFNEEA